MLQINTKNESVPALVVPLCQAPAELPTASLCDSASCLALYPDLKTWALGIPAGVGRAAVEGTLAGAAAASC